MYAFCMFKWIINIQNTPKNKQNTPNLYLRYFLLYTIHIKQKVICIICVLMGLVICCIIYIMMDYILL